jgi:hypothetical protein
VRLSDISTNSKILRTLNESDEFILEMANFIADVTELPANIVLWTKTQPEELPHNKYRMKVYKDRIHVATYSIGQNPTILWSISKKSLQLDSYESKEVVNVISMFSSIFISYVDGVFDKNDVKYEIKRISQ